MAGSPRGDIEELTLCSSCRRPFDEAERAPKLLACRHHFCLACARSVLGAAGGAELYCPHCWKRTPLPAGRAAALPTHHPVLALARRLAPPAADTRRLRAALQRLAARRRDLLLRALDAATALKLRLEAELAAPLASPDPPDDRLRARHAAALSRARLDDLVRESPVPLDFDLIRRALDAPGGHASPGAAAESRDPLLLLANYCTAQLYARRAAEGEAVAAPLTRGFPLFFLELEVNGAALGRVVLEVRADVAPRMARNFAALATGELGVGYRGCAVFQCWENESVITGDFELNNGRGGRSAFEESYFMPDDTRLAAVRGAVGMRRSQKRHDNLGLVGSQFRIVLREMRGFTAIFGFVLEGLELVDRLSRTGDSAGKPHGTILISDCGKLE